MNRYFLIVFTLLAGCFNSNLFGQGIALYGIPKYTDEFRHFDYVNPDAPKGGSIKLAVIGGFDNIVPYPTHKIGAEGTYLLYDSLLKRALDEPFACYPRIASSFVLGPQDEWVQFNIDPRAQFHDLSPITSEDVKKTIEIILKEGPFTFRQAFQDILKIEVMNASQIKFYFREPYMRSLALFIGILPILPAKELDSKHLDHIGYEPFLGNGPYRIKKFVPNKLIEYERVKNYWGQELPCQKGQHNFDVIRFDYFRNYEAAFQAFKAGTIDIFEEEDIGHWLKNYNFPAAKKGHVQLRDIPHQRPLVFGFVFNTRRPPFDQILVRKALSMVLDLEQLNKQYFHNAYEEIPSFFGQTDLSAPSSNTAHQTDIKKNSRQDISEALAILKQAGFAIDETKLCSLITGKPFQFEIMLQNPQHDRLALFFKASLEKLGIDTNIRLVDAATYQKRLTDFDFDMIINTWQQSMAPEREQLRYWGSATAHLKGSANYAGIHDAHIDAAIMELLQAKNRDTLIPVAQRLDQLLQKGYYVIPLLQKTRDLIAYWNRFGNPKSQPITVFPLLRWWCIQSWWHNEVSH